MPKTRGSLPPRLPANPHTHLLLLIVSHLVPPNLPTAGTLHTFLCLERHGQDLFCLLPPPSSPAEGRKKRPIALARLRKSRRPTEGVPKLGEVLGLRAPSASGPQAGRAEAREREKTSRGVLLSLLSPCQSAIRAPATPTPHRGCPKPWRPHTVAVRGRSYLSRVPTWHPDPYLSSSGAPAPQGSGFSVPPRSALLTLISLSSSSPAPKQNNTDRARPPTLPRTRWRQRPTTWCGRRCATGCVVAPERRRW